MAINFPGDVATDAPIGTETGIVSRDIFRKRQTFLTATPLAANAVYRSRWFDSELTGTNYVAAVSVSNVSSAATVGLQLQESEDQVNTRVSAGAGASSTTRVAGFIRARYWRIQFTNGASPQTTFSLYCTEASLPIATDPFGSQSEGVILFTGVGGAGIFADGFTNASSSPLLTQSGGGGMQRNACYLFNGALWDRPRTPIFFKQVATAATGSTALWTPTAAAKFRLMRYKVQVTALAIAAAGADLKIALLDAGADIGVSNYCTIGVVAPTFATGGPGFILDTGWIDLGNGYLSTVANNVLNINLSFALTAGLVNVIACGTEE